jgi:hypothetical protein
MRNASSATLNGAARRRPVDVVSIEAGRLAVAPQHHDAVELSRETLEVFQPLAAAKRVWIGTDVEPDSLLARYDHERIDGQMRFAVADTGPGVAPEKLRVTSSASASSPRRQPAQGSASVSTRARRSTTPPDARSPHIRLTSNQGPHERESTKPAGSSACAGEPATVEPRVSLCATRLRHEHAVTHLTSHCSASFGSRSETACDCTAAEHAQLAPPFDRHVENLDGGM